MTVTVVYAGNQGWIGGFSKRIIFTTASALFLLVYLTMWSHHTLSIPSAGLHEKADAAGELEVADVEHVVYCNWDDTQKEQVPLLKKKEPYSTSLPVIYFVTPTYTRPVQIAELTRLGQTLKGVSALHWILVEDSDRCSPVIGKLLQRLGVPFTHLASAMPAVYRKLADQPRGVSNRRAALQWIRSNAKDGVLYFGDDDNTYDLRLFEEIRYTQNISMFPVGLVGTYAVSAPVVQEGKVVGFFDSWPAERRYAVDMAGFAVNIRLLHQHPNATIIYKAGYEEDSFLRSLLIDDHLIEPKAANCTQILVWHTQTVKAPTASLQPLNDDELPGTSMPALFHTLEELNLATFAKKGKRSSVHYLKVS